MERLTKGVLTGGDMVKYLGQDDTPLHFWGYTLNGNKTDDLFLKGGTFHDPISMDNVDFKIFQTIIKRQLKGGDTDKWNKIVNTCMGFYEETFMGVRHLYTTEKTITKHQNW